jgi:dihydroorotate dehydrogenase
MMTPEDIRRMIEAGASLVALNSGIRENGIKLLKQASRAIADNSNNIADNEKGKPEVSTTENSTL